MPISNKNLLQEVRSYIIKAAHADESKIKNSSLFFKEGFIDSMGFIMLITFIEEEFGIKTKDEDLVEENFESINAICSYLNKKLQSH